MAVERTRQLGFPSKSVVIADSLYNLHPSSGATDEYRKGIMNGIVSGLMATGYTFEESIMVIAVKWNSDYILAVPESWKSRLIKDLVGLGKQWVEPDTPPEPQSDPKPNPVWKVYDENGKHIRDIILV